VSGFCRVDPTATGFATSHCNGAAKSAGQAVYDATHHVVYVADQSANSSQLVRFNYDQVNEAVTSPLIIQVPNNTAVGGGKGGGRAAALALKPGRHEASHRLHQVRWRDGGDRPVCPDQRRQGGAQPGRIHFGRSRFIRRLRDAGAHRRRRGA
jgi:hypothetical protein